MTAAAPGVWARPVRLARPKLAVDTALFALEGGRLKSYLVQLKQGPVAGKWAFPGGLVRRGELLDDAARRELEAATGLRDGSYSNRSSDSASEFLGGRLAESSFGRTLDFQAASSLTHSRTDSQANPTLQTRLLAAPADPLVPHGLTGSPSDSLGGRLSDSRPHGLSGSPSDSSGGRLADSRLHGLSGSAYLEQLFTFGDPSRDPFAHVVAVAYMALTDDPARVSACCGKYASGQWYEVTALPPLAYDHALVADYALNRLRAKLTYTNIAVHLLPPSFTFAELEDLYASVLERPLDRRNFRRRIMASGLLRPLGRMRHGAHRPASLFSFAQRSVQMIEML